MEPVHTGNVTDRRMTTVSSARTLLLVLSVVSCLEASGCRKRASRVEGSATETTLAPVASPGSKDTAPPSVYDAGNAQAKEAASKDRRFMKLALAFRDGGNAQRKAAREEMQKLPANERAEFETLCKNMGIKTE